MIRNPTVPLVATDGPETIMIAHLVQTIRSYVAAARVICVVGPATPASAPKQT